MTPTIDNVCARYRRGRRHRGKHRHLHHSISDFIEVGDPLEPNSERMLELDDYRVYLVENRKVVVLPWKLHQVFAAFQLPEDLRDELDDDESDGIHYHSILDLINVGEPMDSESDEPLELADDHVYIKDQNGHRPLGPMTADEIHRLASNPPKPQPGKQPPMK